jgi:hypothetical protein
MGGLLLARRIQLKLLMSLRNWELKEISVGVEKIPIRLDKVILLGL